MEFIGEYLKNVRLEKNIRLSSISSELKIPLEILKNIEKDIFPEYIDKVFLVGHISSYAKFLNLDRDEIVQNFKIQTGYYNIDTKTEIEKPVKNIALFSIPRVVSYLSVMVFASSFYLLFVKTNNFQNDYAMTPDVPESLIFI